MGDNNNELQGLVYLIVKSVNYRVSQLTSSTHKGKLNYILYYAHILLQRSSCTYTNKIKYIYKYVRLTPVIVFRCARVCWCCFVRGFYETVTR